MNRDKKGSAITNSAPNPTDGQKDTSNTSTSSRKSLKDIAQSKLDSGNATQLGDPISLKAETADSSPTDDDRGAAGNAKGSEEKTGERKTLKQLAEANPTQLGDPVSLKAETVDSEPTENDRGAMSQEDRKKRGSKI